MGDIQDRVRVPVVSSHDGDPPPVPGLRPGFVAALVVLSLLAAFAAAHAQNSDLDGDGVVDEWLFGPDDNCLRVPNQDQADTLAPFGIGDACDGRRVALVNTVLTDDGDDDGFADTRETVDLQLRLRNIGEIDLTGVSATILASDPRICVSDSEILVEDLPVGQNVLTSDAFRFHVGDVERATVEEQLSVELTVILSSDQVETTGLRYPVELDLDLDLSGGSGESSFHESFEAGDLGAFEIMNLDAGIPGANNAEGLQNAQGMRCAYSDPDWINGSSYGNNASLNCYPGLTPSHADAVFWQADGAGIADSPDGGRAFSGTGSLYFGVFLTDPAGQFTTPLNVMEAVRTTNPINLGVDQPTLSFWHQISLADHRIIAPVQPRRAVDRGVVQIQYADDLNQPIGPWINLEPFRNVYDSQAIDNFFNCFFDPIDDGSTEDDFFNPDDPSRDDGPSSSCYPGFSYAYMGDTTTFDPDALGYAGEGPGVQGALGAGTWVESFFDLQRFRGRKARLRFLVAGYKAPLDTWENQFSNLNPDPRDDGWWIDDVHVDETLAVAATLSVDTKDNSGLSGLPGGDADGDGFHDVCDNCASQANVDQVDGDRDGAGNVCDPCPFDPLDVDPDADGVCADGVDNCPMAFNPDQIDQDEDGAGLACDCNDTESAVYPGAPELNDGLDNQCPLDPGHGLVDEIEGVLGFFDPSNPNVISWPAQPGAGSYRVMRSELPDFSDLCAPFDTLQVEWLDGAQPAAGGVFHYVVRARSPNPGSWGQDSEGQQRVVACE